MALEIYLKRKARNVMIGKNKIDYSKVIAEKDELILQLKSKIISLQRKINVLRSPVFLYKQLQNIQGEYASLLNPLPILFDGKIEKSKFSCELKVNDVICIITSGDSKSDRIIYLKTKLKNILKDEEINSTDKIIRDKRSLLDDIATKIDPAKFHLCQISQSAIVNLAYYDLVGDCAIIKLKKNKVKDLRKIRVSSDYLLDFKDKAEQFQKVRIFQKI